MNITYTPLLPDLAQEHTRLLLRRDFFISVIEQGHSSIDSQPATPAQLAGFISSFQAMDAAKRMIAIINWQLYELSLLRQERDRCPLTNTSLHEPYPI